LLPIAESLPQLAANEDLIRQCPQSPKPNIVGDEVADDRSVDAAAAFRSELVAMTEELEQAEPLARRFSTRKCAIGAECKQNLSETIAKEPRAATQLLVVIFLVIYKGSRFRLDVLS
jgi:hypothetical protein